MADEVRVLQETMKSMRSECTERFVRRPAPRRAGGCWGGRALRRAKRRGLGRLQG